MAYKFYLINIIKDLKFTSFWIGFAMFVIFGVRILDILLYSDSKQILYLILKEFLEHRTYITFMIIFLFIFQVFIPDEEVLKIMLGV